MLDGHQTGAGALRFLHPSPLGNHHLDLAGVLAARVGSGDGRCMEHVHFRNHPSPLPPLEYKVASRHIVGMKPEVVGTGQLPADVIVAPIVLTPVEFETAGSDAAAQLLLRRCRMASTTWLGTNLEQSGLGEFLTDRFELRRRFGILDG